MGTKAIFDGKIWREPRESLKTLGNQGTHYHHILFSVSLGMIIMRKGTSPGLSVGHFSGNYRVVDLRNF